VNKFIDQKEKLIRWKLLLGIVVIVIRYEARGKMIIANIALFFKFIVLYFYEIIQSLWGFYFGWIIVIHTRIQKLKSVFNLI